MNLLKKYYREDGKVGILLSASENLQWYTDNFEYTQAHLELLYCPPLVKVLSQEIYTQQDIAKALIEFGCTEDWQTDEPEEWKVWVNSTNPPNTVDLFINYKNIERLEVPDFEVYWLDPNTKFQVIFDPTDDYDRENEILREILILADDSKWLTA